MNWIKRKIFKNKSLYESRVGNVVFLSRHKLLDEFCHDLITSLSRRWVDKKITFFVGIHENFSVLWARRGVRVAIQTEQLCDSSGIFLWPTKNENFTRNIISATAKCDVFWDLSLLNMPYYQSIGVDDCVKKKGLLGPHVFPSGQIQPKKGTEPHLVFFGLLNDRRKMIIQSGCKKDIKILKHGTFGAELISEIERSGGVLNIHAADGVFSEVPRLLTAHLRGKTVYSEELAFPFVRDVHYIGIPICESIDRIIVHKELAELVSRKYSFDRLVKAVCR